MPFYFAYGANLDRHAMSARCPGATVVTSARLINHRFFIMRDGYASVRPVPGQVVHGLLWHITPRDVGPLDAFEEVGAGLYGKITRPVMKAVGSTRAFLYVGHTLAEGPPRPGYLEAIVTAAHDLAMPESYIRVLASWGRGGGRGGDPFTEPGGQTSAAGPVTGVRPRLATPLDRPSAVSLVPSGRTPPRRRP